MAKGDLVCEAIEAISVSVRRGGTIEARHRVHAVAVRDGQVVAAAGYQQLVCLFRSSAKPIQALPLARSRPDLADCRDRDRVRVPSRRACAARGRAQPACAGSGYGGRPRVRRAGGAAGWPDPPQLLREARRLSRRLPARGWATRGYRQSDHPLQQELLEEIAAVSRTARRRDPDRSRRLRRGDVRAVARAHGSVVRRTRRAGRRRPHPRRDARASRARGRRGLARYRSHAQAARMGGEGRRRGAALRCRRPTAPASPSSPRTATPGLCARRSRVSSTRISVPCRSRIHEGKSSGRWSWSDGSRT